MTTDAPSTPGGATPKIQNLDRTPRLELRPRKPPRKWRWMSAFAGLFLAVLVVFPLLWVILGSVKTAEEVNSPELLPSTVALENYTHVFSNVPFARYLFNSFFVAGAVTV